MTVAPRGALSVAQHHYTERKLCLLSVKIIKYKGDVQYTQNYFLETKAKETVEDNSSAAPWLKERPLKHVDRAPPLGQITDGTNYNNSQSGPDVRNVGGATIFSSVPSSRLESLAKVEKSSTSQIDGDRKLDSLSISKSEKEILNEKDQKNGNNKWLSDSPRSRDLLTPIKRSSVDVNSNPLETRDENTPPN